MTSTEQHNMRQKVVTPNAKAFVLSVAASITASLVLLLGSSLLTKRPPMSESGSTNDSVTVEVHRADSR